MPYAETMRFAFVLGTVILSASGAALLTQCSSSSDDTASASDAGSDTSLAVCPAIEPSAGDPCPTQTGLACSFGCDTVVCVNGSWSEVGNADAATDAGSCPTTPPNNGDPCASGACIAEQICGYACANHLGATTASCIEGQYQVFTDPACSVDPDAGADAGTDAGDGGDGG